MKRPSISWTEPAAARVSFSSGSPREERVGALSLSSLSTVIAGAATLQGLFEALFPLLKDGLGITGLAVEQLSHDDRFSRVFSIGTAPAGVSSLEIHSTPSILLRAESLGVATQTGRPQGRTSLPRLPRFIPAGTEGRAHNTVPRAWLGLLNGQQEVWAVWGLQGDPLRTVWSSEARTLLEEAASVISIQLQLIQEREHAHLAREQLLNERESLRNERLERQALDNRVQDLSHQLELERRSRQQDQSRLQAILDTLDDAVWVLDARGRTRYVNRQLLRQLRTIERDLLGRSFREVAISPDTMALTGLPQSSLLKPVVRDLQLLRPDGTVLEVSGEIFRLEQRGQVPDGHLIRFHDPHQLSPQPLANRASQEELERRVEERTRVLIHLIQDASRMTRFAETMAEIARLTETDDPVEAVIDRAFSQVAPVAGLDWVGLCSLNGQTWEGVTLARSAMLTIPQEEMLLNAGPPLGCSLLCTTPGPEPIYQTPNNGLTEPYHPLASSAVTNHSLVVIPIQTDDARTDRFVMAVRLFNEVPWDDRERQLIDATARSLRLLSARRRRMQLMTVAALTDALTGLGNRRAFDRDLEIEIARAGRHSTSLSVLILDLDGLKAVNDGLGHQAGDLLLRCVGDELRRAFRLEDRIYRLGGDEFALLLPHTSGDYSLPARQRLDGVRSAVRARGFEHVDFSTGLATFPQEAFSSTSLWQLADSRMYEEKLAHRRVGRSSISNELVQTLTEPPPSAV